MNDYGEVVGMVTSTSTTTNNPTTNHPSESVGFAIPINRAMEIFEVLKQGNKPTHAYFGVELTNITPDSAKIHNDDPNVPKLPENIKGALVLRVIPSSPAAEASFRKYDVITEINGVSISDMSDAEYMLDKAKLSEYCHIKVVRGGGVTSNNNNNNNNNNNAPIPMDMYVVPQDLCALLEEEQLKKQQQVEEEEDNSIFSDSDNERTHTRTRNRDSNSDNSNDNNDVEQDMPHTSNELDKQKVPISKGFGQYQHKHTNKKQHDTNSNNKQQRESAATGKQVILDKKKMPTNNNNNNNNNNEIPTQKWKRPAFRLWKIKH